MSSSNLLEKFLKIDDPFDAFSVHGGIYYMYNIHNIRIICTTLCEYIMCRFWGVKNAVIFACDRDDVAFAGHSESVVEYDIGLELNY